MNLRPVLNSETILLLYCDFVLKYPNRINCTNSHMARKQMNIDNCTSKDNTHYLSQQIDSCIIFILSLQYKNNCQQELP